MHAKVKYNASSSGNWTQNKEYDVLGFVLDGSDLCAVVVDDSGAAGRVDITNGTASLSQAYAVEKVA